MGLNIKQILQTAVGGGGSEHPQTNLYPRLASVCAPLQALGLEPWPIGPVASLPGGGGGRWRPKRGPSRVGVVCVCGGGEGNTIVSGPGGGGSFEPPPLATGLTQGPVNL